MRKTKLWLATAAVLLCGATGMYAQAKKVTVPPPPPRLIGAVPPSPVAVGPAVVLSIQEDQLHITEGPATMMAVLDDLSSVMIWAGDGPLGELVVNEKNNVRQYEYTSNVITLKEPTNVLYFTFLEGYTRTQSLLDRNGYPFVALAEFQLYDANGEEIKLEAHNFSTNAQESSEGPVADICDGDRSTYFHSTWSSGASDYHYLRVELPKALSAFSFKYYTRNSMQCVPKKIGVSGYERKYSLHEDYPIELTEADGLLDSLFINEGCYSPQHGYTSSTLTLEEPSNVLYFTFLEGYTDPRYVTNERRLQYPFMALAEFQLYDANGKEIALEACNFSTNAPEKTEGPIADICDGDCRTYFHTSWTSSTSDYHYLRVALPDTLSAFSFKYYTRDWARCVPKKIGIKGEYCEDPYVHENPYSQVLAQGTCGENVSWTLKYGGHLTISGEGDMEITGYDSPWEDLVFSKVTIEDGVTSICDRAFSYCSNLAIVSIPASVTRIGRNSYSNPFSGCNNLKGIEVDKNNPVFDSRDNCNAIIKTGANALLVGCKATRIPTTVVTIEEYAFDGCRELESIYIPKSVTTIEKNAFSFCGLSTIVVDKENPVYDSRDNCNAIIQTRNNTLVLGCVGTVIPTSVKKIGDNAFRTSRLASIVIPEGVTSIGQRAFAFNSYLSSVSIPKSVKAIGTNAFYYCPQLTSIEVDEDNEVYDSRNSCNAIIETATNTLIRGCLSTTIPDGITMIGDDAFNRIDGLGTVIIPESVSEIGNNAFASCGITSITIPGGVTRIGNGAFWSCENLTSIIIPKNVTEIGNGAFGYCRELTEITLPKRFKGKEKELFANCDKLKNVKYKNIASAKLEKQAKRIKSFKAYVDLGLPSGTKWATCNIGARKPHETGCFFAWGETNVKDEYSLNTYFDQKYELFDTENNSCISGTKYDAATILWGKKWMMPTCEQAEELYKHCTWEWTDNYESSNVAGCICTGPNGNHIFFPANGLMMGKQQAYVNYGNFWTGSLFRFNNIDWANFIDFNRNGMAHQYVSRDHRYWGRSVRPVRK